MASGMLAGPISAMAVEDSKPATPASCSVGTSCARGERDAVDTASIFSVPAWRCGRAVMASMNDMRVSPASTACAEGAPPR
jgi:hypothetical protein